MSSGAQGYSKPAWVREIQGAQNTQNSPPWVAQAQNQSPGIPWSKDPSVSVSWAVDHPDRRSTQIPKIEQNPQSMGHTWMPVYEDPDTQSMGRGLPEDFTQPSLRSGYPPSPSSGGASPQASSHLVVRNTFLELEQDGPQVEKGALRRAHSDSDISSDSIPPSRDEIEAWLLPPSSSDASSSNPVSSPPDGPQNCPPGLSVPEKAAEELYYMLLKGYDVAKNEDSLQEFNDIVCGLDKKKILRKHIPRDDQGRLTSIGSIVHSKSPEKEHCQPCLFFVNGRCKRAELCIRCHYVHTELATRVRKTRPSNVTRKRRARLGENPDKRANQDEKEKTAEDCPAQENENVCVPQVREKDCEDPQSDSGPKKLISL